MIDNTSLIKDNSSKISKEYIKAAWAIIKDAKDSFSNINSLGSNVH